jgi:PAS domain S-box-containing protein
MLALAVLSVLPLVLLHTYTLYAEYRRAEDATYRAVLVQVDLAARTVDDVLSQAQAQLRLVARRRRVHQHDTQRCASLLQALAEENRLLVRFDVHTAAGTLVCSSAVADTDPPAQAASWVADVMSSHGVWLSSPFVASWDGGTHHTYVVRLALATDSVPMQEGPAEVLSALVDLQQLSESLSPAALPGGSVLSLYDADGRILARNPDFAPWVGKTMPVLARNDASLATSIATTIGVDGVERLYASSRLQRAQLQVSAGVPTAAVTRPLVSDVRRSTLVALLTLLAGLGLAAYWSRIVSRSLRRLARAAAELASGRQAMQIDNHLPGELGALATQFNLMLEALQARSQALQASQRRAVRLSQLNEALSEAAHAAARVHDLQQLYERICQICVDTGQASVAWLSINGARVAMAADASATDGVQLPPLQADDECDGSLEARWHACCANGEVVVEDDFARAACCVGIQPTLLAQGVRSAAALPVFVRGQHAGNLNLYANEPEFFDPDAIRLLKAICSDLTFALETQETERARRDAERALAQREQQLAGIIDTAMDAIITTDASQRIVVFNQAAAEMFKVEPGEAIGGTLDRFVPDSARVTHHPLVQRFAQAPALRLRGLRATGEEFPLDATLVKLGSGADLLMTATLRDVSRLEEAQAAKEAEARAKVASRAKTEFISNMSHELRTPLNAVLGFSQLLQSTARSRLTSKELQQLNMIFLAGAQLRSLIDEALDLSRIEAGRVELRMEDVELCALMREIMLLLEPLAQENGVRLHIPPERCSSLHARTDHKRLRQILLNVLSLGLAITRHSRPPRAGGARRCVAL